MQFEIESTPQSAIYKLLTGLVAPRPIALITSMNEDGGLNAAPFSARLLTNAPLPSWHKATPEVRAICRQAAEHCRNKGVDIAQLALQFSIQHPDMATCITGSADPGRVAQWVEWANKPLDQNLLREVFAILEPIHNWFYVEGRPENNDEAIRP